MLRPFHHTARLPVATAALTMVVVAVVVAAVAVVSSVAQEQADARRQLPGASILQPFEERVAAYVEVHRGVARSLAPLGDKATPEQITRHKTLLAQGIRAARAGAKAGDVFTPAMAVYVRDVFEQIFARPQGAELIESIMAENPTDIRVEVNETYPPEVPLSTMPPLVLAALPKLPEDLEYRFVGAALVMLDPHADLVVDLIPDALRR